jgi:Tol biopolymer transport system component
MEPEGSGVRKLTDAAADGNVAAEPVWSPDGTKITFVLSMPEHLGAYAGDGDIYVMNADGTGMIKLTTGLRDAHPAWSPDGTRIVFVRDEGNSLLIMNADRSEVSEIRPHFEAFLLSSGRRGRPMAFGSLSKPRHQRASIRTAST